MASLSAVHRGQANFSLPRLIPTSLSDQVQKVARFMRILFAESFATVRYVIPAGVKWCYKAVLCRDINSRTLRHTADGVNLKAHLYLHGKLQIEEGKEVSPVLLVHGDYGHPFSLLHLAEKAKKVTQGPIFNLYIPGVQDERYLDVHSAFLKRSFQIIEQKVNKHGGRLKGILGVGHSKGATLLAKRHFCHLDRQLSSVFAIAGRVRVPEGDDTCPDLLKPFISNLSDQITIHPERPFIQIVPEEDWHAPREAMDVRSSESHIVKGFHLSALYTDETTQLFEKFLVGSGA